MSLQSLLTVLWLHKICIEAMRPNIQNHRARYGHTTKNIMPWNMEGLEVYLWSWYPRAKTFVESSSDQTHAKHNQGLRTLTLDYCQVIKWRQVGIGFSYQTHVHEGRVLPWYPEIAKSSYLWFQPMDTSIHHSRRCEIVKHIVKEGHELTLGFQKTLAYAREWSSKYRCQTSFQSK